MRGLVVLCLLLDLGVISSLKCHPALVGPAVPAFPFPGNEYARCSDFHFVAYGDMKASTGDIQGACLCRGDFSCISFSVGDRINNTTMSRLNSSLVVGGVCHFKMDMGDVQPANLSIFAGEELKGREDLKKRWKYSCDGDLNCLDPLIDVCYDYHISLEDQFNHYEQNIFIERKYDTVCNVRRVATNPSHDPLPSDVYFTKVSNGLLNNCQSWLSEGVDPEATFIIMITADMMDNSTGTPNITFSGGQFGAGLPENVIFYIPGNVMIIVKDTYLYGSIIAPDATLDQQSGTIKGFVIVGHVINVHQVDSLPCDLQPL